MSISRQVNNYNMCKGTLIFLSWESISFFFFCVVFWGVGVGVGGRVGGKGRRGGEGEKKWGKGRRREVTVTSR